jgi:predicted outer membrane protein
MITEITESKFIQDFKAIRPENFSYDGLSALFDYFEQLGEDVSFDPIAICCEFSEHESALEAARQYTGDNAWNAMTQENANESALNWLYNHTQVIQLDNGAVIIQDW